MKLYTLGPAGTNSHEAAQNAKEWLEPKFGPIEIEFCGRNFEVLERASQERVFGVSPVENSSGGYVAEVVKDFWLSRREDARVRVIGEMWLPVEHCFLVQPGVSAVHGVVTTVVSHPQALAQCRGTLGTLGTLTAVPETSTAAAAKAVAESKDPKMAALASRFAGKIYGLTPLCGHMEDQRDNATRFHVVAPFRCAPPPTGRDRTAVLFETMNTPGALSAALEPLTRAGINMSSIHSIPTGRGKFAFYSEFDAHLGTSGGQQLRAEMRHAVQSLVVLGSYPQSERGK